MAGTLVYPIVRVVSLAAMLGALRYQQRFAPAPGSWSVKYALLGLPLIIFSACLLVPLIWFLVVIPTTPSGHASVIRPIQVDRLLAAISSIMLTLYALAECRRASWSKRAPNLIGKAPEALTEERVAQMIAERVEKEIERLLSTRGSRS